MIARPALALVALLSVASPAAAQQRGRAAHPASPAPATDWARHVERTPEGGYRMGNPDAPLKLVEYGSVTCSHCAEFAETADRPLRTKFIRTGRVSFEYRPFTIFPSDPGLFVLMECQAPGRFFDTLDRLYATQESWVARLQAQRAQWERLTGPAMAQAIVRVAGVGGEFALAPQRIQSCLANVPAYQGLRAQSIAGEQRGVQGTPTFFLNGRMIDVASWADLERMLSAG